MTGAEFYLEDLKSKFTKINPNEYALSYSGGRDSHLLLWFIKEYAKIDGIEIISVNTYMEHPEILARMKEHADRLLIPKLKPMEIKEKYGSPCFSKRQDHVISNYQKAILKGRAPSPSSSAIVNRTYAADKNSSYNLSKKASEYVLSGNAHRISPMCCKCLKKDPIKDYEKETGRKSIMGVRSFESQMRSQAYTSCFTKDRNFTPIWDLSDSLMREIYEEFEIETPQIYNHIERTGCMGCPYGIYKKSTQKELKLMTPAQRRFAWKLFEESYKIRGLSEQFQIELAIEWKEFKRVNKS